MPITATIASPQAIPSRSRTLRVALGLVLLLPACRLYPFNQRSPQEEFAREVVRPAEVAPVQERSGLKVQRRYVLRVYADRTYRRQNQLFHMRIRRQVERASALLASQFGARLEVEVIRPWDRDTLDSDDLAAELAALVAEDPGQDVDWVVGFVGARTFSQDWHAIGTAQLASRHLVVRGAESLGFRQWLDRTLTHLYAADREELYEARKLHVETLALLHEWAHALGVPHDRLPGSIMAQHYDPKIASFSKSSRRMIERLLPLHGIDTPDARREQAERALEVLASEGPAYDPETGESLRSWARDVLAVPAEP